MANYRIAAAFRSARNNECYFFVNGKWFVLNYMTKTIVIQSNGTKKSRDTEVVFPILRNTRLLRGIDCAFNGVENTIFIFVKDHCAKIRYTPEGNKLLNRLGSITDIFPMLKRTSFESGIDAAFKYTGNDVFLFKREKCIRLNYDNQRGKYTAKPEQLIHEGFPCLVGTVFETGIDAAFASHVIGEAYIFKGRYFAHINAVHRDSDDIGKFIVRRIRIIGDVWPKFN